MYGRIRFEPVQSRPLLFISKPANVQKPVNKLSFEGFQNIQIKSQPATDVFVKSGGAETGINTSATGSCCNTSSVSNNPFT